MAESQAQFDTVLAQLGPALTSLQASVAALVAAVPPTVDLSAEAASVNQDLTEISTIAASLPTPTTPAVPSAGGTTTTTNSPTSAPPAV